MSRPILTVGLVEFVPPIESFIGEQLGKIIIENETGRVAKLLPLPEAIRRLFKESQRDTQVQTKEDARHVLKASDAIQIIREEFTKFAETADILSVILPAPGTEAGQIENPVERAVRRIREEELRQDKPRIGVEKKVYTRKP